MQGPPLPGKFGRCTDAINVFGWKCLIYKWNEQVFIFPHARISKPNKNFDISSPKSLKNMKNLLSTWKCRSLSIKGKITVIYTLAISPLLYLANVIYVPPHVITEVKDIIVDFLWDVKPPKIAYNVLIKVSRKEV